MPNERVLLRCPVCSKISPPAVFAAGERGEDTHSLLAKVVAFVGGGREGRPLEQGKNGRLRLQRDPATGKALPGRGFDWSSRDLTPDERVAMVRGVRAVANRLSLDLMRDVLQNFRGDMFEQFAAQFMQECESEYATRGQLIEAIRAERGYEE